MSQTSTVKFKDGEEVYIVLRNDQICWDLTIVGHSIYKGCVKGNCIYSQEVLSPQSNDNVYYNVLIEGASYTTALTQKNIFRTKKEALKCKAKFDRVEVEELISASARKLEQLNKEIEHVKSRVRNNFAPINGYREGSDITLSSTPFSDRFRMPF